MSNIIDSIQVSGITYTLQGSGGNPTVELTQEQYNALVSAGTVSPTTYYIITDAEAVDMTNYYTKSQTSGATQISTALNAKQNTLVAGDNISISGNVISASGGGASYSAGRGIDITNDTISFNLPISAGTGEYSIIEGNSTSAMSYCDHAEGYSTYANGGGYPAHAEGYQTSATTSSHAEGRGTKANGYYSHAEGISTVASGNSSHAEGKSTVAYSDYSHTEGYATSATSVSNVSGIQVYYGYPARHSEGCYTKANNGSTHTEGYYTVANNFGEHASGVYNASNSATTTFGDSGNTLFSVGNGTADNARHNAFEIRQNGDIYLSLNGQDVKLQDQLGGGAASSAITSGDTNAVAGGAVYSKFDEVEQVTAAALNVLNDKFGGLKLQQISQSDYDVLVSGGTVDSSTLYIITNVVS